MTEITLKQLRTLVAIGETGNMRRAADTLSLSQPSLSAQLDALELHLGTRLVERGRRGSLLTATGREIAGRAEHILAAVTELQDYAVGASRAMAGTIRFGVKASVGPYLMPLVVEALHRQHPELHLFIREEFGERLVEELLAGHHDLVLVETPVEHHELKSKTLFEEALMLVCASDHPLAARTSIDPKQLRGARVLAFSGRARVHAAIGSFCERVGATLVEEYESTSLDALRLMTGSGLGLCFLPELYVRSEIRGRGDVVAVPIEGAPLKRRIGLAWRRSAEPSPTVHRIKQTLAQVVAEQFPELVQA